MKITNFLPFVALCMTGFFTDAQAQLGKLKIPKNPAKVLDTKPNNEPTTPATTPEKANPSNPTQTESPAAGQINSFENYAKSLQYCLDNKVWRDANRNEYTSQLSRAKTALEEVRKKDASAAQRLEPRYLAFEKAWSDEQSRAANEKIANEKAEKEAKEKARLAAIANRPTFGNEKEDAPATELHKKNLGKVLVLTDPTPAAKLTEAAFKTKVGMNEHLYFQIYTEHTMENYAVYRDENDVSPFYNNAYQINFILAGKKTTVFWGTDNNMIKGRTAWLENIRPKAALDPESEVNEEVVEFFNALPAGEHLIEVEVVPKVEKGSPVVVPAKGAFTLVKKAGEVAKYHRTFSENIKEKMNSTAFNAQTLTAIQTFADDQQMDKKFSKARFVSTDWTVEKNNLGVILLRSAEVQALGKDKNGRCAYHKFFVYQDYLGGGQYQKTVKVDNSGKEVAVDCE